MRTIDASHLAQLKADELRPFDLLTLTIDGTDFKYTDCDVPISNMGPEAGPDPRFNGSCGDPWTCETGWSVAGNKGSCDGSQVSMSKLVSTGTIISPSAEFYTHFTLSGYSAGNVRLRAGVGDWGTNRSSDGTYEEYLTCGTTLLVVLNADADFVGDIENLSFRELIWGSTKEIWAPRGFRYDAISYSMTNVVDQLRIVVDNTDDYLTSAFVGGAPRGSDVVLKQTVLDSDDIPIGAATAFQGTIDSWDMKEGEIEIVVSSELFGWNQRSLALYSASCRWKKFKGTECGYSGSASWCDRTYARCETLGNAANFGGFRWLPSIQDKEIWWGREWGELPKD